MNSYYHAVSAAKKYGGIAEDYIELENFIDSSKAVIADVRHRSMYHHSTGIFLCQKIFGHTITVDKEGKHPREVPVRLIAELHVMQDLGWIPSPVDYIKDMTLRQWHGGAVRTERSLQEILEECSPGLVDPVESLIIRKPETRLPFPLRNTYLDRPGFRPAIQDDDEYAD